MFSLPYGPMSDTFGPNGPFRSRIGQVCENADCNLPAVGEFRNQGGNVTKLYCDIHAKDPSLKPNCVWQLLGAMAYKVDCFEGGGATESNWLAVIRPSEERWARVTTQGIEKTIVMYFRPGEDALENGVVYSGNQLGISKSDLLEPKAKRPWWKFWS